MSDAAATEKEQIIIAEDSPPNRKILAHLLEKLGYQVIACENGRQAWDELTGGKHPRVVALVSDIMMPTMDGLELLKAIRENEKFKALPVILVTAISEKDYIVQARNNNVSGYILKPVTFQRVQEKLKELFPNKQFPQLAS